MPDGFDPYHVWLGIPPDEQPPDNYRLLGLRQFESNPDVILNAGEQRIRHLRAMQVGSRQADSQKLLNEVAVASQTLLSSERKQVYDSQLSTSMTRNRPEPSTYSATPIVVSPPQSWQPQSDPVPILPQPATIAVPAPSPAFVSVPTRRRNNTHSPLATFIGIAVGGVAAISLFWLSSPFELLNNRSIAVSPLAVLPQPDVQSANPKLDGTQSSLPPGAKEQSAVTKPASLKSDISMSYSFYHWNKGDPPVKMIHGDEGFCYLTAVSGTFQGLGESVKVTLEEDGFWYLSGHAGSNALAGSAVGVKVRAK